MAVVAAKFEMITLDKLSFSVFIQCVLAVVVYLEAMSLNEKTNLIQAR